jgi:hypothetical protein
MAAWRFAIHRTVMLNLFVLRTPSAPASIVPSSSGLKGDTDAGAEGVRSTNAFSLTM